MATEVQVVMDTPTLEARLANLEHELPIVRAQLADSRALLQQYAECLDGVMHRLEGLRALLQMKKAFTSREWEAAEKLMAERHLRQQENEEKVRRDVEQKIELLRQQGVAPAQIQEIMRDHRATGTPLEILVMQRKIEHAVENPIPEGAEIFGS